MKKGLTLVMLAGAALFGVASVANAQDYQYQGPRMGTPNYTINQQRGRVHFRAQDETTEPGNATPPAAGEGRVNSDDQG